MGNFDFLSVHWIRLAATAHLAETFLYTDPAASIVKMETLLENIILELIDYYSIEGVNRKNSTHYQRTKMLKKYNLIPEEMGAVLKKVEKDSKDASSYNEISIKKAEDDLKLTYIAAVWFAKTCADNEIEIKDFELPKNPPIGKREKKNYNDYEEEYDEEEYDEEEYEKGNEYEKNYENENFNLARPWQSVKKWIGEKAEYSFFKSNSGKERKKRTIEKLKEYNIAFYEDLPPIDESSEVELKTKDEICRRALACLFSTQIATDILETSPENDASARYNESKKLYTRLLKKFKVSDELLSKEKILFSNKYNKKIATDVFWTYETYWALIWALGLISDDEFEMPDKGCNLKKAIMLVLTCRSYENFKEKCRVRDIEEILDMLDLYYRYHWACEEKKFGDSETAIGDLQEFVVLERRRGLEWLIREEKDWNNIPMYT